MITIWTMLRTENWIPPPSRLSKMRVGVLLLLLCVPAAADVAAPLVSAPRGGNAKIAERDDQFLAWFTARGGVANGVTVGQSEWGRGVFVLPEAAAGVGEAGPARAAERPPAAAGAAAAAAASWPVARPLDSYLEFHVQAVPVTSYKLHVTSYKLKVKS